MFRQINKVNIAKTDKPKTRAFWKARPKTKYQCSTSAEKVQKLERREVKIAKCVKKDRELKKTNIENLTECDEKMKNKSDRKRKG